MTFKTPSNALTWPLIQASAGERPRELMRECSDILAELESWYARETTRHLHATVQGALEPLLETAFGYHLLQIGHTRDQPLYGNSRIRHRAYLAPAHGAAVSLVAQHDELPIESDSVDVVIAHHSLDFTQRPHEVLRELQRVLTPHGQLLLVGFNPLATGCGVRRLRGLAGHTLWQGLSPVSARRLLDWLRLLGLETQSLRYLHPLPVAGQGRIARYAQQANQWSQKIPLPLGEIYLVHAVKQVGGRVLPVRRSRPGPRLIGLTVPKPAAAPRGDHAA